MPARKVPLRERFMAKYRVAQTGCWEWTGCKDQNGYGGIQLDGEKRRAHRVAWTLKHGPIPDGLMVCHRCDNPSCVNPGHLFLGTADDNNKDKVRKNRGCRGETHGRAKLGWDAVREIRARDDLLHKDLAREYGVSKSLIGQIKAGEIWREAA